MEQAMAQQDQISCSPLVYSTLGLFIIGCSLLVYNVFISGSKNSNQQITQQMNQQQMMLCPVQLVYESPILMQSGDQMQANQTIFINPQNPPPWARSVQNQVIYVQQLPSNNMIPLQQHVDTNQLYLQQNYVSYPHMVPQIIQNQQALVPNVLPANVMQSIQGNIQNVQGSIQNMQNIQATVQNMQNYQGGIQNIQGIQNLQNVQTNVQNMQAHIQNAQANVQNVQTNVQTNVQNIQAHVQNLQNNVQSVQANAQNVPTSIQGNVQNIQTSTHNMPSGRLIVQAPPNYEQSQTTRNNNVQNTIQNQIVMVQNMNNQHIMNNMQAQQQMINQNMLASQKPTELPKQIVYRNIVPHGNQSMRPPAPQMMNQMQNMTNIQGLQQMGQMLPIRQPTQMPRNIANNAPQNIQQSFVNMPTSQAPIIRNIAPNMPNTQTAETRNIVPNIPNQAVRNIAPNSSVNSGTTVSYNAVRNGQSYTYRAIQPRPPQQNKNVPSLLPMQNQPLQPRTNIPNIDIPSSLQTGHLIRPTNTTVSTSINNVTLNYVRHEENTSRKRKSESPDEVQKKIATSSTVYGNMTVTAKASPIPGNISSVGVNTSPVRKIEDKNLIINQSAPQHSQPIEPTINKIKTEPNMQAHVIPMKVYPSPKQVIKVETRDVTMQTEKEKLVRNTVFTQARGRLLNDKQNVPLNTNSIENKSTFTTHNSNQAKTNEIIQLLSKTVTKIESSEESNQNDTKNETLVRPLETTMKIELKTTKTELPTTMTATKIETECKENLEKIHETPIRQVKTESKIDVTTLSMPNIDEVETKVSACNSNMLAMKTVDTLITTHLKSESIDFKVNPKEEMKVNDKLFKSNEKNEELAVKKEASVKVIDNNIRKSKMDYTNVSLNDLTDKEIRIVDGSIVKDDKEFLLTHVLDGYVIQESNVPFAIRRPLKEKSLFTNPPAKAEQIIQEKLEDIKDIATKDENLKETDGKKILDLTHLHLNEEKLKEESEISTEDKSINPFGNLKPALVKSWTVEQLSEHLEKYEWNETISLFREHEIDGESLFLVSKPQLVTIGVNEDHAEVICEFVKS